MNVLVTGGTGTVGREVVRALLARHAKVRVLTRAAEKSGLLPAGAEAAVGDLRKPATLRGLFRGAEAVFLLNGLSPDETEQGLAGVMAAKEAGARKIVYLSVQGVEEGRQIPHFATKIPVEKAVRESGIQWTILRPNNFYQNDIPMRDAIVRFNVYPQPVGGIGLSRVDVRDIAEAATAALCESGHAGRTFTIAGPEALTGEKIAAIYSQQLGREIRYGGDDLDAWAAQMRSVMPEWMIHDLRLMYEHFHRRGLIATEGDLAAQRMLIGHAPRSFESFVAEVAPTWRTAAAGS